jgi:hypothetical protein
MTKLLPILILFLSGCELILLEGYLEHRCEVDGEYKCEDTGIYICIDKWWEVARECECEDLNPITGYFVCTDIDIFCAVGEPEEDVEACCDWWSDGGLGEYGIKYLCEEMVLYGPCGCDLCKDYEGFDESYCEEKEDDNNQS